MFLCPWYVLFLKRIVLEGFFPLVSCPKKREELYPFRLERWVKYNPFERTRKVVFHRMRSGGIVTCVCVCV